MIKELLTSENIKKLGFVPCEGTPDNIGYMSHLYYYKGFRCISMDCFLGNWSLRFDRGCQVSFEELCKYTKYNSYYQIHIEDTKNRFTLSSLDEIKDIAEDWLQAYILIMTKRTENTLALLHSFKKEEVCLDVEQL